MVDTEQLVGAADIAGMLGVVPSAVNNWVTRDESFPSPVARISNDRTPIWLRNDILRWYVQRKSPESTTQLIERHRAILAALEEES